jgi:hypothetical protein
MRTSRRHALLLLVPLSLLAACGDDATAPRARTRVFAFSHIAGLAPDSGYACAAPADGAVSRVFVGGDGAEMRPDGRFWINLYVHTWERYPSTAQYAETRVYNRVGQWSANGEALTLSYLEDTPLQPTAAATGDSLVLRIAASCKSGEVIPGGLAIVYKESQP